MAAQGSRSFLHGSRMHRTWRFSSRSRPPRDHRVVAPTSAASRASRRRRENDGTEKCGRRVALAERSVGSFTLAGHDGAARDWLDADPYGQGRAAGHRQSADPWFRPLGARKRRSAPPAIYRRSATADGGGTRAMGLRHLREEVGRTEDLARFEEERGLLEIGAGRGPLTAMPTYRARGRGAEPGRAGGGAVGQRNFRTEDADLVAGGQGKACPVPAEGCTIWSTT